MKYRLGSLIKQRREKYDNREELPIRGVSRDGFIRPKQKVADKSLYNVFYMGDFVFNPARMEINSITFNSEIDKGICSSLYEIFYVDRQDVLIPEYLNLFVKREEFARLCEFIGIGSAREYCRVDNLSDIEIYLPPLEIQEKYVAVYRSMLENQEAYENGLEDLKMACDLTIQELQRLEKRRPIGDCIELYDKRNSDNLELPFKGLNINNQFINSIASKIGLDFTKYKIVEPNTFACNLMHVGRDKRIPLALNTSETDYMVSAAYFTFKVVDKKIRPEYLMMLMSTSNFDYRCWFNSDNSIRGSLEWSRFCDVEVPIASIELQENISLIYKSYLRRKEINETLKQQIKDICPILIAGAIKEAKGNDEI